MEAEGIVVKTKQSNNILKIFKRMEKYRLIWKIK